MEMILGVGLAIAFHHCPHPGQITQSVRHTRRLAGTGLQRGALFRAGAHCAEPKPVRIAARKVAVAAHSGQPGTFEKLDCLYAGLFCFLGFLVLLLPTHYSLQLLYGLEVGFGFIVKIFMYVLAVIAYLVSLFLSLFSKPSQQAAPEAQPAPQFNPVQPATPTTPIPWLETVRAWVFLVDIRSGADLCHQDVCASKYAAPFKTWAQFHYRLVHGRVEIHLVLAVGP